MSHQMLGPCCLCPLAYPTGPDFVEAAIYMVPAGLLSGEYVASCAKGRCDYFAFIERLYNKNGLYIENYPRREFGERVPPRVKHHSEDLQIGLSRAGSSRPLKRTFAMLDINAETIPIRAAGYSDQKTVSELLAQLDARVLPGIPENQFSALFARCECGLVTTARAFNDHKCRVNIIDLTRDD
ncbi:hypothetical protein PILCRDRAFT_830210 [Piloderma croceum F 1598]|uniref:Uncharacterized protein n=1 Tax=Piloderma croceum (strain F 1598) TaxID=765440 RepID=A0A0C3EV37_PILCF|nr:hypothetical protein PILCRDRAFT_830210 [Piloderma croceum F 1598]